MPSEAQQLPERVLWSLGGDPVTLRSEGIVCFLRERHCAANGVLGSVINNTIFPKD